MCLSQVFPKSSFTKYITPPHMTSCQLFALAILTMSGSAWHPRAEKPLSLSFFFFPSSCFPGASSQPGPHTLLSQGFQLPLSQQRAGREVIERWTCQKWRSPRVWATLGRDLEPSISPESPVHNLNSLILSSLSSFSPHPWNPGDKKTSWLDAAIR